jgi:plastocyanin
MRRSYILAVALAAAIFSAGFRPASAQQWGDLEGQFLYKGKAPANAKVDVTKDVPVCGKHKLTTEKVVVGKEGGLANVVLYLLPAPGSKAKVHPDYDKLPEPALLDNKNCRFEPHVVALRTGQKLTIGNSDPVGHNTKAEFFNNTPFNDLIPAGGKIEKTFMAAETAPTKVECSIHPWMNGYVLVRDNPYYAVTDAEGKFKIANVPAGEHTFVVWHETGYLTDVTVNGKATKWNRGRAKLTIKSGKNELKVEAAPVPK